MKTKAEADQIVSDLRNILGEQEGQTRFMFWSGAGHAFYAIEEYHCAVACAVERDTIVKV